MKDLIKQLNEFKKIEPDEKYWHINRSILLNTIKSDSPTKQGFQFKSLFFNMNIFTRTLFPSFKVATVSLMVIAMMFVTGMGAQAAMPGNLLYPVKIGIIERTELAFTKEGSIRETNIRIKHASNRLKEINYLLESNQFDGHITKVSERMKNHLNVVKTNLQLIKNSNVDKSRVVKLAKVIDKNTINTSKTLGASSVDLLDEGASDAINEVIKANEELSYAVLDMIINSSEELAQDEKELIKKSLDNKIELWKEHVGEIGEKITKVKESLEQSNIAEDSILLQRDTLKDGESDILEEKQTTTTEKIDKKIIEFNIDKIEKIESNPERISEYLENAKKLSESNEYKDAFIEIEKAQFYLDLADDVLDSVLKDTYKEEIEELEQEIEEVKGESEQSIESKNTGEDSEYGEDSEDIEIEKEIKEE